MNYLTNKVVMITGASSGIGRGLALALARRGGRIGLLARRAETLQEIVNEIQGQGGKAVALPADVQSAHSIRAATAKLRATFGPIDLLIANAGIGPTSDA